MNFTLSRFSFVNIRIAFLLQVATAVIPSLIFLSIVPIIKNRLNIDGFAGFTVIVSSVGLFSMLDGGLGRAVTYFVSMTQLKKGNFRSRAVILGGIALGLCLSIIILIAGFVALRFFNGEASESSRDAIYVMLLFSPVFVVSAVVKGALEGQQRFAESTLLQLVYSIVIGISPIFLIHSTSDITAFSWFIGLARTALLLIFLYITDILKPSSYRLFRSLDLNAIRLFSYSKWLLFSNILGLCIVFADRVAIIGYFSTAVVACYVVPMELIARSQLLISSFCSVIFPKLVKYNNRKSNVFFYELIKNSQGFVVILHVFLGFIFLPIMEPLIRWWLGDSLASQSSIVVLVGIVGLGLISCSAISMLAINGLGHTRQISMLHVIELTIYLVLLAIATYFSSLYLLLAAWLFRMFFDAVGMALIFNSLGSSMKKNGILNQGEGTRWILIVMLSMALLIMIFFGSFFSNNVKLGSVLVGAVCSMALLANLGSRIRTSVRDQLSNGSYTT